MPYIQWREELSVGVPEIDEQHKEMFARINRIIRVMREQGSVEEVVSTVDFMERYAKEHFSAEEKLMVMHDYPAQEKHERQHEYFRVQTAALKMKLADKGPSEVLLREVQKLLVKWFAEHIDNIDRALGRFLKLKLKM